MKLEEGNLQLRHRTPLNATSELLGFVRKMDNELKAWERTLEILQNKQLMRDVQTAVRSEHISREKLLKKHGLTDEL